MADWLHPETSPGLERTCVTAPGQPLRCSITRAAEGGGEGLTREQEDAARLAVGRLAGHDRGRASAAYLGAVRGAVLHNKKAK